jgi:hypothetical protein
MLDKNDFPFAEAFNFNFVLKSLWILEYYLKIEETIKKFSYAK